MRWMVRPLAICVLVGIPALAAAQSSGVAGRVTDATGSALPGVTVTLTAPTIIGTRTEVTDGTGSYRFEIQSPGTHTLKFELAGFKTLVRDEVIVSAGRTTTVNALVEVGEIAETVTVTGASPVVDLENAAVGVNFTADMLQSAPNARDIWAVLAQTPGVTMQRYDVGGSGAGSQSPYRSYGFSGQTYILMDGMNVTEGTSGAGWFYTDYGMFSEIQIVSASKGADVPNAGTFINQVVRSGSNAFHGEFYTDYNNENFQGDNINDELRALGVTVGDKIERYNDVNGQVGGPVLKDKLWFFYSGRRQYSGLQTIGFTRADNGQLATFYTILTNNTWKFNSRLGSNDLSYLGGYHYKFQPHRGGGTGQGGEGRFFTTASTGEQRQPTPIAAFRWTNTSLANAFTDVSVNWGKQDWGIERHQEDIDGSGPEANTVSRRDLTTRLVRGGYSGVITGNAVDSRTVPFRQIRPRLQISPSVTHYTDRLWTGSHAIKAGYVFNWEEFENPRLGNVEHLIEYYRDNFQTPDSIDTYNSPLNTFNRFRQHSFFVNDRWTAGKWTLNLGVRYDRYINYYPAQGNTGEGPFSERIDVSARTLPAVGGLVPRFSVIYDFFGNGRTAIKASAGRYIFNPGTSLAENVNPNALVQRRYRWDGTNSWPSRGIPFVARPEDLVLTISGRQLDIHPDFEVGYTDEFTLGFDQELVRDVLLRLNWVQRWDKNKQQLVNVAIPYSAYNIPVATRDPGPDGVSNTSDDQVLTLFSLDRAFVGRFSGLLVNLPEWQDRFKAFDIEVVKRFSNNWDALAGFVTSQRDVFADGIAGPLVDGVRYGDPNRAQFPGTEKYWEVSFKAQGTYRTPWDLNFSSVFRSQRGLAHERLLRTPTGLLNQGTLNLKVEPVGSYFYPNVSILDARVERQFRLGQRGRLDVIVDVFNLLNSSKVTQRTTLTGANFINQVSQILNPRIFRLGARYTF